MSIPPQKGFCDVYRKSEPTHIVLKCEPAEAIFLLSVYPDSVNPVTIATKTIGIYLDGIIHNEEIKRMISNSYNLVKGISIGESKKIDKK